MSSEHSPLPAHLQPAALGLVAVGGAVGTLARHAIDSAVPDAGGLPVAIVGINVLGAFLLGVLTALAPGDRARLLLGTGVLGGFTTYSTYALDTRLLLGEHHPALAVAFLLATLAGGFAASVLGLAAGRRWHR